MKLYLVCTLSISILNIHTLNSITIETLGLLDFSSRKNRIIRLITDPVLVFNAGRIGTMDNLGITTNLLDLGTFSVTGDSRLITINASYLFVSGNEPVSSNLTISGSYTQKNIDLLDPIETKGLFTKSSTRFITTFGINNTIQNIGLGASPLARPNETGKGNTRPNIAIGTNATDTLTTGSKVQDTVRNLLIQTCH